MTSGYRDGDALNVLFNSPSSLVYFKGKTYSESKLEKYKPFLFSSNSSECLHANYSNYTSCVSSSQINSESEVDRQLVKLIYFPEGSNSDGSVLVNETQIVQSEPISENNNNNTTNSNTSNTSATSETTGTDDTNTNQVATEEKVSQDFEVIIINKISKINSYIFSL